MMSARKLFTPFIALGMLAACSPEAPTVNVAPGPAPNVTVEPPMVVVNPPVTPPHSVKA